MQIKYALTDELLSDYHIRVRDKEFMKNFKQVLK